MDEKKFPELYRKYAQTAYYAANPIVKDENTAQDIVQEVMLKIYLSLDSIQEDKVEGLVKVAARRMAIDHYRKAKPVDWEEIAPTLKIEGFEDHTVNQAVEEEEESKRRTFRRQVMDALQEHNETEYYITKEIRVNERSEKEVAEELGITENYVRVRLSRAKKWLHQHFGDEAREKGFL